MLNVYLHWVRLGTYILTRYVGYNFQQTEIKVLADSSKDTGTYELMNGLQKLLQTLKKL